MAKPAKATKKRSNGSVPELKARRREAQQRHRAAKKQAKEARKLFKSAKKVAKRAKDELQQLNAKLKSLLGRVAAKSAAAKPKRGKVKVAAKVQPPTAKRKAAAIPKDVAAEPAQSVPAKRVRKPAKPKAAQVDVSTSASTAEETIVSATDDAAASGSEPVKE